MVISPKMGYKKISIQNKCNRLNKVEETELPASNSVIDDRMGFLHAINQSKLLSETLDTKEWNICFWGLSSLMNTTMFLQLLYCWLQAHVVDSVSGEKEIGRLMLWGTGEPNDQWWDHWDDNWEGINGGQTWSHSAERKGEEKTNNSSWINAPSEGKQPTDGVNVVVLWRPEEIKQGHWRKMKARDFFSGERKGIGCAERNDCVQFF